MLSESFSLSVLSIRVAIIPFVSLDIARVLGLISIFPPTIKCRSMASITIPLGVPKNCRKPGEHNSVLRKMVLLLAVMFSVRNVNNLSNPARRLPPLQVGDELRHF